MAKETLSRTTIRNFLSHEYKIFAEFADFCREPCEGFFLTPSENDVSKWMGVMTAIGGMYDGAFSPFTLQHFFEARPRLVFSLPLFHPLVDPRSGEFDLNFLSTKWSPRSHARALLQLVRQAFHDPAAVVSDGPHPNASAALLFRADKQAYRVRVLNDISVQYRHIANEEEEDNPNPSQITFGPWIPELHETLLTKMLENVAHSNKDP